MPHNNPNIVFILTDQQQATAMGAVDDSFHTPNLDQLTQDGTLFTNCYTTTPQCSPARSSIITGQYPHQTGVTTCSNWGQFKIKPESPSMGKEVRDSGYETAWFGKWHLGQDRLGPLGWEQYGCTEQHYPASGNLLRELDERSKEASVSYLNSYDSADPFFLTVSYHLPHPPWYTDKEFAQFYNQDKVELPPNFDESFRDKPSFQHERANQDECNLSPTEFKEIRYKYRTMVSRMDSYVGEILDALKRNGYYEDTTIIFTSDHGDMQGAHQLNKKGVVAYDELLRVPLIVKYANRNPERDRISDLVSVASVPSTIVEEAGSSIPSEFEEPSLNETLSRSAPADDQRVFFEHKYAYWGEHPYVGVRTKRWKYVDYIADDVEELYDLDIDPHEMNNIATAGTYDEVKAELQEEISVWLTETGGNREEWGKSIENRVQLDF